jgi:diguanylate cyclase (GGDEF)-like protein
MRLLLDWIGAKRRAFLWAVAGVLLCTLFALGARTVQESERSAQLNLKERFRIRVDIAEPFVRSYVQEILDRERMMAESELSTAPISATAFDAVVHAAGFMAAVVVDSSGKLLQVYPAAPHLIGTDVAVRYAHLRDALANGSAVSAVVHSAAVGAPIVGFAARYASAGGPRVFSGAYDVRMTPLNVYMSNVLAIRGARSDLVDGNGTFVASNRRADRPKSILAQADPLLAAALSSGADEYTGEHGRMIFVARAVTGTPWRMIFSVEASALFAPLAGKRWVSWTLFSGFCVTTLIAAFLLLRLIESRAELRALNAVYLRLARYDWLTDLPNRLHLEEHLARLVGTATRHKQPLSIFIADIDHFKFVNDSCGHQVGDEVLRALAVRMAAALRVEDMLGRWGGEEFLALLPNTTAEGAVVVANRVRAAASASPVLTADGRMLLVTVSIGCATKESTHDEDFIGRADAALYSAKNLGRDRVVSSAPPAHPPDSEPRVIAN